MKKRMLIFAVAVIATLSGLNVKSQTKACLNPCAQSWISGDGKNYYSSTMSLK